MPFDEDQYPTLTYMRCKKCGNIFVMRLAGTTECPECSSGESEPFKPDEGTPKTPKAKE
jgi:predicted Zn-ribbon and HTH transcriptional regulator